MRWVWLRPVVVVMMGIALIAVLFAGTDSPAAAQQETPRVDGSWAIEATFDAVRLVGNPADGLPGAPDEPEFGLNLNMRAQCDVGACDVEVPATSSTCLLSFDGTGWTGNLSLGIYRVPGCTGGADYWPELPEEPMSFTVTDWVETAEGLVATEIAGRLSTATYTAISGFTYSTVLFYDYTFVGTRSNPPDAEPADTVPDLEPGPLARVEGSWRVTATVTGLEETVAGAGTDLTSGGFPAIGETDERHWFLWAMCDTGPCDVAFDEDEGCALAFSGGSWSGQMQGGLGGCAMGSGTPRDQPVSFRVVDWVDTADGPIATTIEGVFRDAHWFAESSDGELTSLVFVDRSFIAVRENLPALAPPEPDVTDPVAPTEDPIDTATEESPDGGALPGGGVGPATGQTIAEATNTPAEVSTEPSVVGLNVLLALALVALMPFPADLFNNTLDENSDRIRRWWTRLAPWLANERERTPMWMFVAVTVAGGLLAGFLDPGFGFDLRSLAVFMGGLLAVAAILAVTVGTSITSLRRSVPGLTISPRALPSALIVGVACVILSRAIGFEPGYLYGVLAGVAVVGLVSSEDEGKAAAISMASLGAAALAAWLIWWPLQSTMPSDPGFGWTLADTFLAALFVAGLEGLAFGMVPMRFMAGSTVMRWNRRVWAVMFGVGVFLVLHFLAHPGEGYGPTESALPFATVIALFVGFGILSVGFWAWFRFRPVDESPVMEQAQGV